MLAFYFAGTVNLFLGLYVLAFGGHFLSRGVSILIGLFFLGFAAVDFYFPKAMRKKWTEDQQQREAAAPGKPPRP
jgi:hypothetical protein